jgi:ferredoxin
MGQVLSSLEPLLSALHDAGYTVIGPTVRDGAIVMSELESAAQLPYGVGVDVAPGRYRLRERADAMAFGHAAGPQSTKTFLHPPRTLLFSATRGPHAQMEIDEPAAEPPRYAFVGVRDCDLRAIDIQQRVLGRSSESEYARARARAFIVAVNCTEPASTCFCVSAGGGPQVESGFDVALTELADGTGGVHYLAEVGSTAGERMLAELPTSAASEAFVAEARDAVAAAATQMGRTLPDTNLHDLLAGSLEAPRWDEVAQRCLACGNCTMVCPTCFCTTVNDTTDVTGDHAQRWQTWDSCFDLDFSYLHGGPVRPSVRGRYRQWLTHKLGTWHDQFGESGCVGCGRCIAWCPVGIDITEETNALAVAAQLSAPSSSSRENS